MREINMNFHRIILYALSIRIKQRQYPLCLAFGLMVWSIVMAVQLWPIYRKILTTSVFDITTPNLTRSFCIEEITQFSFGWKVFLFTF